ncbi:MAG: tRNA pseudouridine(55) synthase TruB [Oscillospiraceae bacterium]|jgi:tRNA pseudouridine55 synthase|nr:tRNA pseudouridine(55) synthase TruB [Oscillospiraceae bacterium]
MNGIIVLDKPEGFTSHDAVAKLRGILSREASSRGLPRVKRIGHGGTLDPMATGVLPIFVGRATRAVSFFEHADKEYVAGLRLGMRTDTQDTTGSVLETAPVEVTRERLEGVMRQFEGAQMQTPPMYSAVKVAGQPLYKLARRGVDIERTAREITVSVIEIQGGSDADWTIRFAVSKGTYIRTLCADIGDALGCGGAMSSLRRTRAGAYTIENALSFADIESRLRDGDMSFMLKTDSLFDERPSVTIGADNERKLRVGAEITESVCDGEYRVYSKDGEFLALCSASGGALKTVKSFFEVG